MCSRQPPSVPCDRGRRPGAIQRGLQPPLSPPPRETLRDPQAGQARCARGPGAPCASGLSVSPSSAQLLHSSPAGVAAQCPGGFLLPLPEPGLGSLTCGWELSLLWGSPAASLFSGLQVPPPPGMAAVISLVRPSHRLAGSLPCVFGRGVWFPADPVLFADVVQRLLVSLLCSRVRSLCSAVLSLTLE